MIKATENNDCRVPIVMAAIAWPLVIPILTADSRFFPSSRLPLAKDKVENDYFLQEHVITRKMLGCTQILQIV